MRTTSPLVTFRRLTNCTLIAAISFALAAEHALAQTAPPDEAPAAAQSVDPPSRVARLNYTAGTVTTEPAGASDWSYASINRPLTTGDQLWNDANARSELHIGSTALRLGASTNLDILNLDDTNAQLKVTQGTLSTHVRALPPGSSYEIDTPNVALAATRPGDYRVDVAPDGSTTTVTVRSGALTAYGDNGQTPIEAGEQITFSGTSLQEVASAEAPPPDEFDRWARNRDVAEDRSVSARYVSRDVPGYEDLDENGTWREDPQYGAVWVPTAVPAGWAPYHYGHWAWIAPWGWTWVDNAPWGFAPFHYGRWAYVGSSWCWVPGRIVAAPPVYAPALVAFVGGGGGGFDWSVSLSIGGAPSPGVAWFPLGPGEAWRPHYGGWSPRYYERVNQTVVVNQNVNITNIHNTYINYRAPGAVTAVPATAFVHGQPVARFAQKVDPRQWRNARMSPGAPGIAPVRESYAPGMRPATYRPPQSIAARQVVATRAPAVPPVYRDSLAQHLAQSGGQVPGAGRPGRPMTPPAGVAAQLAHPGANAGEPRNVRIVGRESPVVMQGHGPAQPGERPAPGAAGGPNGTRPGFEPRPQAPAAERPPQGPVAERPQTNGVPRPPAQNAFGGGAAAGNPAHGAPAWTQPHAPAAQGGLDHARQPAAQQFERGPQGGAGQRPGVAAEAPPRVEGHPQQAPQPQARFGPPAEAQPRAEARPQPEPQPRVEARPQPQSRMEARPQPQPQPRVEARPQPQPRMEARPQPQPHIEARPEPQPHFEPRPQPQPQPRVEVRQPPPPQPHFEAPAQPHAQPHEQTHPQQGRENHPQG
ncbi:DUF6600 domain-containing protein [Trinickia sp. EG282A]|uniref:DUF6600 domain-containing protein n=1 Tax=Trinickia sp. EG282A TaxID=3237013 RepID=UPI0034D27693